MASYRPLLSALAVIGSLAIGHAQPFKYGCHYTRNLLTAPHTLTDAERAAIDDVIARSDTFDIQHTMTSLWM